MTTRHKRIRARISLLASSKTRLILRYFFFFFFFFSSLFARSVLMTGLACLALVRNLKRTKIRRSETSFVIFYCTFLLWFVRSFVRSSSPIFETITQLTHERTRTSERPERLAICRSSRCLLPSTLATTCLSLELFNYR